MHLMSFHLKMHLMSFHLFSRHRWGSALLTVVLVLAGGTGQFCWCNHDGGGEHEHGVSRVEESAAAHHYQWGEERSHDASHAEKEPCQRHDGGPHEFRCHCVGADTLAVELQSAAIGSSHMGQHALAQVQVTWLPARAVIVCRVRATTRAETAHSPPLFLLYSSYLC